jgi:hypothetical protein
MRQPYFSSTLISCGLALLLAGPAAWAESGCLSLSGCSYQAGQGLPGQGPAPPRAPAPGPRAPVVVNSCDAGGCLDPDGRRYNNSTNEVQNGVFLDPQGRRCIRSGEHLQCG